MANDRRGAVTLRCTLALLLLAGCGARQAPDAASGDFPAASRPVATIVSPRWSTEAARDTAREAQAVMDAAGVGPGMTVADVGAGEGYYAVRLAARVGPKGRVLAQDIVPAVRDRLAQRITAGRLDNVSVVLGRPADPDLPPDSFDRVLMIHMYHEIASPFEFLWRLRPALKPDGLVAIVDADRPTANHGTPPALLDCELAAVGYRRVSHRPIPSAGGYLALYAVQGARPAPSAIRPCGQPAGQAAG